MVAGRELRQRLAAARREGLPGRWLIALYCGLVLLPLAVAALTGYPLSRFPDGLAAGLGIASLAGLLVGVGVSPRLPLVAARVGVGRILRFRRMAATAVLVAALLHPIAFVAGDLVTDPGLAFGRLATMLEAPGLLTGVLAALLLALVAGLARLRRLPLSDRLRSLLCAAGTATAILLALWHALRVGTYAEESRLAAAWAVLAIAALAAACALLRRRLRRQALTVESGRRLGPDLVEILARAPDGQASFRAGEFFRTDNPLVRGEELVLLVGSAPEDLPALRLVVAEPGDLDALAGFPEESEIRVDGPCGRGLLETVDADVLLLVASGAGIAPVLSVLRALTFRGDGRPVRLVYGARTAEDFAFSAEIEALGRRIDLVSAYVVERPNHPEETAAGIEAADLAEALRGCDPDRVSALVSVDRADEADLVDALMELGVDADRVVREPLDVWSPPPGDRLGRHEAGRMALVFAGLGLAVVLFALN